MASLLAALTNLTADAGVSGQLQAEKIADPAAGAGLTYPIVQCAAYRTILFTTFFQASATVANRTIVLRPVTADGLFLGAFSCPTLITAGQGVRLTFAANLGAASTVTLGAFSIPFSDMVLQVGMSWLLTAIGIDATDQFSGTIITGERYWIAGEDEPWQVPAAYAAVEGV